jgi:hypothetical protein
MNPYKWQGHSVKHTLFKKEEGHLMQKVLSFVEVEILMVLCNLPMH